MLVLYQTQKAPPRFHGAGSFVKLGRIADNPAATNDCQSPAMQLHSGETSAVVKVDILPNSTLSDLRKCRALVRSCESRKVAGAYGLHIADNPAATNGWSAPTMQLHSGGWWSLHLTQSATRRVLQTDRREHYSGKVRSGLSSSSMLTSL